MAQFLSLLAVEGRVAASTQNQALSALLCLYRYVLQQEPRWRSTKSFARGDRSTCRLC
jgi:Phage integrase, N-terminal SAM-like domain